MGKKRFLDRKIRSSQSFAGLTYRQRDLWQGILTVVDDQGRMPGSAAFVRSEVWPFDEVSISDVESDLIHLETRCNYVLRYHVDDHLYLQVVKWWNYQPGQWAMPSDHPSPEGWIGRERYNGPKKKIITRNWDDIGGFPDGQPSRHGMNNPSQGEMNVSSGLCVSDSVSVSDSDSDSDTDDESTSSSVPHFLDIQMVMEKICNCGSTTEGFHESLDAIIENNITEERMWAWYKDKHRGWERARPSTAERDAPWPRQLARGVLAYKTDSERYAVDG
jgi:hypothetical protein